MKRQHRASAHTFPVHTLPGPHMPLAKGTDGAVAGDAAAETANSAATDTPHRPAILIEIDPSVRGNFVHNRFDIMIRGRAISDAPIRDIRLEVGDQVMAIAC